MTFIADGDTIRADIRACSARRRSASPASTRWSSRATPSTRPPARRLPRAGGDVAGRAGIKRLRARAVAAQQPEQPPPRGCAARCGSRSGGRWRDLARLELKPGSRCGCPTRSRTPTTASTRAGQRRGAGAASTTRTRAAPGPTRTSRSRDVNWDADGDDVGKPQRRVGRRPQRRLARRCRWAAGGCATRAALRRRPLPGLPVPGRHGDRGRRHAAAARRLRRRRSGLHWCQRRACSRTSTPAWATARTCSTPTATCARGDLPVPGACSDPLAGQGARLRASVAPRVDLGRQRRAATPATSSATCQAAPDGRPDRFVFAYTFRFGTVVPPGES